MGFLIFVVAVFVGFLAGILVNALSDSMPHERSPKLPHYPDGSPRPISTWSGTLAFLLGERENDEGSRLSWRHPIVEVFMGLFFGFIVMNWSNHERTIIWMIYITILMVVAVIDIEHYLILFPVIIPSCIIALIIAVIFPESDRKTVDYLIGAAFGGGVFLLLFWGGVFFSSVVASARGEKLEEVAFGFGDVILATLCGLMIGWQAFIFALLITVFAGAAGAMLYMVLRLVWKQQYSMFTALPYGPYIVFGTVVMMLWREEIKTLLGG